MILFKNINLQKPKAVFIVLSILSACAIYAGVDAFSESEVDFNAEVRPIINTKCIACHGGVKQSGGFSLLFREEALGKTKSGKPAIIPGNPDKSEIMKRLTSHDPDVRMPLGKDPLSADEIAILKRWIKQGAHWQDHWSFIKPQKNSAPPDYDNQEFVKNDIDRFVLEKLDEINLKPSPEADKTLLIRRVSLDITGLPPTEKEVNAFLKDNSSNAYEKVVDRLLKSQAYGERWAGMWLDLARYADSKGYEKDQHRNIWRYRDYVIKSFNEDKPYDKFTIEQLAGDLLPNPSDDQIIATAFHRNTMNNDEGGTNDEEYRTVAVIDRVNTTFDVWQGLTIGCVQCHTHPYDPFKHKEYYNFLAFFNNTHDGDLAEEAPTFIAKKDYDEKKEGEIITYLKELTGDKSAVPASFKDKRRKYLLSKIAIKDYDESLGIDFNHPSVKLLGFNSYVAYNHVNLSDIKILSCSYVSDKGGKLEVRLDHINGPILGDFDLISSFGEIRGANSPVSKPFTGFHKVYYILKPNNKGEGDIRMLGIGFSGAKDEKFSLAQKEGKLSKKDSIIGSLKNELSKVINPSGTPVLQELTDSNKRTTHVFIRGAWNVKGDKVEARVPKSLNPMPKGAPNNRLGMAMWLVSKDNPLTARVAVNRFWEQLFGYGIVETLEDFGSQGIKPTHPELLDWMAVKLMYDYNWSMKKILKLMVMSGTYRQSSAASPEHLQKDISNKYLARGPRLRLTAEQIRDQALAVSGLLSSKMYGPSVMPHQPLGVWQTVYSGMEWKLSEGEDKYRRAVYTYTRRTSPYPNMINFDAPSREFCMPRRIRTNTPLQALAMLNDPVYTEASVALAKRMITEGGKDIKSQIKKGYKIALAHDPDVQTLDKLFRFYNKAFVYYQKNNNKAISMVGSKENARKVAPLTLVASAIMNLDEFITKE